MSSNSDPYIDSLNNEIATLKEQNRQLQSLLLIKQQNKLAAVQNLVATLQLVSEL
jgi:hypothetical protein